MRILKFGAIWCMNCLFMEPVWQEIDGEFRELVIENFDIDDDAEASKKFNIKDIPTVVFLDGNGKEILRFEGIKEKEEIKRIISEYGEK